MPCKLRDTHKQACTSICAAAMEFVLELDAGRLLLDKVLRAQIDRVLRNNLKLLVYEGLS